MYDIISYLNILLYRLWVHVIIIILINADVKVKEITSISEFEVCPCISEQDQRIAYINRRFIVNNNYILIVESSS